MTYKLPIWMGSGSDVLYAAPCVDLSRRLGIKEDLYVISAHKESEKIPDLLRLYEEDNLIKVLLCIIGKSNGLSPISDFKFTKPVVAYHATVKDFPNDIWSSLRMPSGIAHAVTIDPEWAVLLCAKIIAGYDTNVRDNIIKYREDLVRKNEMENKDGNIQRKVEEEIKRMKEARK